MLLVNTEHTPHVLLHSPLVGLECKVSLYYSASCEVAINRHTNIVKSFLSDTTIVPDIGSMLSSQLSSCKILARVFGESLERKDKDFVKNTLEKAFLQKDKDFSIRELRHETKISTLDVEFKIETTVEHLQGIEPDVVNMFYTIVHTKVADLQSDPIS